MDDAPRHGAPFQLGEVPALDGLRAISVLLVMFLHFDWLGCGWVGVQFFFVLSGFLISMNFFHSQEILPPGKVIANFYTKRFLRIFPLYYLALGLYFVFQASPLFPRIFGENIRSEPGAPLVYGFFLQNYVGLGFGGFIRVLAHFWSLAVEEQFYIAFPFLALVLGRKPLRALAVALIVIAPVIRGYVGEISVYKNTLTQSDAFGFGILLSLCWREKPFREWCRRFENRIVASLLGYSAAMLALGLAVLHQYRVHSIAIGNTTLGYDVTTYLGSEIWTYSLVDLLAALLVLFCLLRPRHFLFSQPALRYLGRISFGLYVYHYPIAFALEENFHFKFKSVRGVGLFCGFFLTTVLVASASYFLWEIRFLRLKAHLAQRLRKPA